MLLDWPNLCRQDGERILDFLQYAETRNSGYLVIDMHKDILQLSENASRILSLQVRCLEGIKRLLGMLRAEDEWNLEAVLEGLGKGTLDKREFVFRVVQKAAVPVWIRCTLLDRLSDEQGDIRMLVAMEDISAEKYNQMMVEACLDGTFIGDMLNNNAKLSGEVYTAAEEQLGNVKNADAVYRSLISPGGWDYRQSYVQLPIKSGMAKNRIDYRVYDRQMNPVWISSRNITCFNDKNKLELVVGGYININQLKEYDSHVKGCHEIDDVTGLPNREKLTQDLSEKAGKKEEHGFAIFLYVDNLDEINKFFDFQTGDIFLRALRDVLRGNSPEKAELYHVGAGNFVMLMPYAKADQITEWMQLIQTVTSVPFHFNGVNFPYTVSMVAVAYTPSTTSPDILFQKSSVAMNKIKMEGKSKALIFTSRFSKEYSEKLKMEKQIRRSVINKMDGFYVVYQPFIRAYDHRCLGVEALLRWRQENGETVSPIEFIPILENLGLIDVVGEWVLKTASTQCREWITKGFDQDFYVSINATSSQLSNPKFANMVLQHMREIDLPGKNVVIELTESTMMVDFQRGMKQLNLLRKHGLKLAIDDFGTGYSSLSYLKNLPVDEIKIDRSFIQDIEFDRYAREFVASIIKMTQSIGRVICLEGVETNSQMEMLKEMKSDVFQGFLFGRPEQPEELEKTFYAYNMREG